MLNLNQHPQIRAAHRNISEEEIWHVADHGQRFHKAGVLFYYLRRCDIPDHDLANDQIARLDGTAVVLSKNEDRIITVWRNRQGGLQHIKRKAKTTFPLEKHLRC